MSRVWGFHVLGSTPLWRLVAVVAAFGALGCAAYGLDVAGRVDDAATIIVVTAVGTFLFWANRRPERVRARFGPFTAFVNALLEAKRDLDTWVKSRTVLAGVLVFACWGILLVAAKHVVVAAIESVASIWFAAAFGLAIGALVVAPDLWRYLGDWLWGTKPGKPSGVGFQAPTTPHD